MLMLLGGLLVAPLYTFAQGDPTPFASDDFSQGVLDEALWTFVDPVGDATLELVGAGTEDGWLQISLPEGSGHDVWSGGNRSARIMQTVADEDFDIIVKFESPVVERYQLQGLIVEQSAGNYIRLDTYGNGTEARSVVAVFEDDEPVTSLSSDELLGEPPLAPFYLRVVRDGEVFIQSYSTDGEEWTEITRLVYPMQVNAIGVFAGNASSNPPAFTVTVDYVLNQADPFEEEDPLDPELAAQFPSPTPSPTIGPSPVPTATPFPTPLPLADDGLAFQSDDFSNPELNADLWTIVDPMGDGLVNLRGQDTDDAHLVLSVPADVEHNIWTDGNNAVRVMQDAENTNFSLEVKFVTGVSRRYQMEGVLIEQDEQNFLRFDFFSDSSNTRLYANTFSAGMPTVPAVSDVSIADLGAAPVYMRITRDGHTWTQEYSFNGRIWTPGAEFDFPMVVNQVGVFAGNAGDDPAHIVRIDYFFNMAAPIDPEDGVTE
jgi:regulation of enolase protein 1 (concanavalin A-like superfamily)